MKLSGEQRKKLQNALIDAFRSKNSLEHMLSFELEKKLDEISGGDNLGEIVFQLIETAEIILKAINQESAGEFNISAIKEIPCSFISEIDNFWMQYSTGNYSWGVRQNIKNLPISSKNLPFW